MCDEFIDTEVVFNKIEMKNEWNINFLQNTRYTQNVSRLKLKSKKRKEKESEKESEWEKVNEGKMSYRGKQKTKQNKEEIN